MGSVSMAGPWRPALRDLAHMLGVQKTQPRIAWTTVVHVLLFIPCFFTSLTLYFVLFPPYPSAMFGKPRLLETEAQLYDAAIKILMRRAHSVHEMKKALARRCEDESLLKNVVERLKRENLLDDARYAKQFTRLRTESRKQGEFRIARDLRARGVPDRHIAAAKEMASATDVAALIRQRIERKLRLYRGEIDEKKLASLYRSLVGAGFPSDLIRKELHRITHEEIPEVEAPAEEM
jgi:regulatory protein